MKRLSTHFSAPIIWFVIVIAAIALNACASTPSNAQTQNPQSSGQVAQNAQAATAVPSTQSSVQTVTQGPTATSTDEPLAAKVNDAPVTLAALNDEVTRRLDGIKSIGDPLPADMNTYRASVLDSIIDQMLIEQAAATQQITVTDADVETEVQANIAIAGSKEKWQAQLVTNHMTEAEYRSGIHSALLTSKMRDIVTASVGMTAEQVHARHILVASEATANDILNQLKSGSDFAALAHQYSQDASTRDTGGDLGWFAKGELLEPTVEDAAFGLQPNQTSQPVKSKLGYHIIQVIERVKDRPISPETHYKLSAKVFDAWVQSLEKKAKIEKFI